MIHNTAQNVKYFPEFVELDLNQTNLNTLEDKQSLNSFILDQVQGKFVLIPSIKDIPTILYLYEILKENVRALAVKHGEKNIEIFNNELEEIIIPENHNLGLINFYDDLITTSINLDLSEKIETLSLDLTEIWKDRNQYDDIVNSTKNVIKEISPKLKKTQVLNLSGEAPIVFVLFLMRIISYQVSEIYYKLDNSKERLKIK